ncbi:ATP-binding protein [Actinoplanes subtropicus]|uniref:ATP-binding protein n=1 Tax=Actinoplanes subtropicus TaxID=543632 RepID=UPI00068FB745|nr:ATP-binding protein [Actinoplanes subtropicus]
MNDDEQRTLIDDVVTLPEMQRLRHQLTRLARQAGLPDDRAEAFVIAVHEAVINAIRHAGGRGEVAVVQDDQRRLIAEVSDAGPGTPCSVTLTMPPPTAHGGRGLPLAGELADGIEVHSDRHGTTVRLEMYLPPS